MKKIFLIAIATALFTTSALASDNTLYLRADVAANRFTNEKASYRKFKSKSTTSFDAGVGIKLMDLIRTELVYSHYFHPVAKSDWNDGVNSGSSSSKASIDTLMVRGYCDLFDLSLAKIFVGGALGLAQVKEELSIQNSSSTKDSGGSGFNRWENSSNTKSSSQTFRKKNNVAYSLMIGSSFSLNDHISFDVQYIWSDFGKAKGGELKRRSNALSAGARLEL